MQNSSPPASEGSEVEIFGGGYIQDDLFRDSSSEFEPVKTLSTGGPPHYPFGSSPTSVQSFLYDLSPHPLHHHQRPIRGASNDGLFINDGEGKGKGGLQRQQLPPPLLLASSASGSVAGGSSPSGYLSACSSPPPSGGSLLQHLSSQAFPFPGLGGSGGEHPPSVAALAAAAYAAETIFRGSSPPGGGNGGGGGGGLHQSHCIAQPAPSRSGNPNVLTVTADTEPFKVAGVLSYLLSTQLQSNGNHQSCPHCILWIHTDATASADTQFEQATAAARASLMAAQIAHHTLCSRQGGDGAGGGGGGGGSGGDIAMVPFLSNEGSLGLLVLMANMPAAIWQAQGQVLPVEPNCNPLVKGLELSSALIGATGQQVVDLLYEPQEALLTLQSSALARINLDGSGHDVLMVSVQTGAPSSDEGVNASSPLLPSDGDDPSAAAGGGTSQLHHVKLIPASHALSTQQLQKLTSLIHHHQVNPPRPPLPPPPPSGRKGPSPSERSSQKADHVARGGGAPSVVEAAYAAAAAAAAAVLSQSQESLRSYSQGSGSIGHQHMAGDADGCYGMGGTNAADAVAVAAAIASASSQVMNVQQQGVDFRGLDMTQQQLLQHQRMSKADYVIVTEDTAIKNAAGAIAKVTGVVSVAVKAIAVARGYVANEGLGSHQVAFQPFIRAAAKDPNRGLFERRSAGAYVSDGNEGPHFLTKSSENIDADPSDSALQNERSELAFDVFKVPSHLLPPLPEDTHLPVKVTAHSRANVVSNIITKLISERGSAVLITAGGRAMHVAMMAVVSARARLRRLGSGAGGGGSAGWGLMSPQQQKQAPPDILLLPRFVTVDTTNTLGWESVFLRFQIVQASSRLLGSESPQHMPASFAMAAAAAAAAAATMANRQQQQQQHQQQQQPWQQQQQSFRMMRGGFGSNGSSSGGFGGPICSDSGGVSSFHQQSYHQYQ